MGNAQIGNGTLVPPRLGQIEIADGIEIDKLSLLHKRTGIVQRRHDHVVDRIPGSRCVAHILDEVARDHHVDLAVVGILHIGIACEYRIVQHFSVGTLREHTGLDPLCKRFGAFGQEREGFAFKIRIRQSGIKALRFLHGFRFRIGTGFRARCGFRRLGFVFSTAAGRKKRTRYQETEQQAYCFFHTISPSHNCASQIMTFVIFNHAYTILFR